MKTSLCFMWIYVLISHEYIFQGGITWSYDDSLYNFMRNCQTLFQSCCHIFHSSLQLMKGFHFFPHSCQHLLLFFFFFFDYKYIGEVWKNIMHLRYILPIDSYWAFLCVYWLRISPLFFSFYYWVLRVFFLHNLDRSPLSDK